MSTVAERYAAKVDQSGGCWLWTAARTPAGYGVLRVGRTNIYAHRMAYEAAHGPIPDGLWVLHHCDEPACVKTEPDEAYPDGHLFLGTQSVNMHDASTKGRTPHGEGHYRARLTEADVIAIRQLAADGMKQRAIAARYGVIQQAVSRIVRRKVWKHL